MRTIIKFGLVLFIYSCVNFAEPADYYLPKNFVGTAIIFYDQEKGQSQNYVNGRRQYIFPDNGVLYTKFKNNLGRTDAIVYRGVDVVEPGFMVKEKEILKYYFDFGETGGFSLLDPNREYRNVNTDTIPNVRFKMFTVLKGAYDEDIERGVARKFVADAIEEYEKDYWRIERNKTSR